MAEIFKICSSCGNYFSSSEDNPDEIYCSKECYKEYLQCMMCGNYFEIKEMIKIHDGLYCRTCSEDIMVK